MHGRSSVRCINSTGLLLTATQGAAYHRLDVMCCAMYMLFERQRSNYNIQITCCCFECGRGGSLTFHSLKMDINAVRPLIWYGWIFFSALFLWNKRTWYHGVLISLHICSMLALIKFDDIAVIGQYVTNCGSDCPQKADIPKTFRMFFFSFKYEETVRITQAISWYYLLYTVFMNHDNKDHGRKSALLFFSS